MKVTREAKLSDCTYQEQRGPEGLIVDVCAEAGSQSFDPPFTAFQPGGLASGWHITRMLVKSDP